MKRRGVFLGLWLFFCLDCGDQAAKQASPAFYHWQTNLQLTSKEWLYLDSIGVKKLYVKFFDVDWDEASGQPMPLAPIEIDTARLGGLVIVPTVFITNRTFTHIKQEEIPALAHQVFHKITSLSRPLPTADPGSLHTIQFDCDWTESTRDKFFSFLIHFRKNLHNNPNPRSQNAILSATIRLHQLKFYEKTGVPPVDEGMLMCYNTGNLENWETGNSILDPATAAPYFSNKTTYPLPLHFALPLFRWGVVFREGRLVRLINDLGEAGLQDTAYFTQTALHRFEVKQSTYLMGQYLYRGDQLRLESVAMKDLEAVANLIGKAANQQEMEIAFYHIDSSLVNRYPADSLRKLLAQF